MITKLFNNEELKLVFKKMDSSQFPKGSYQLGFVNSLNEFCGEMIYYHFFNNFHSHGKCFAYKKDYIGIWNNLSGETFFYSLYNPGKIISEYEYKKELCNIRLDINNAPPAFFYLDIRIPDNWKEIFSKELEEVEELKNE